MDGDWFDNKKRAKKRSPPKNLAQWIITQSKAFTIKDIEKIIRSVRAYHYLILALQIQVKPSLVGNSPRKFLGVHSMH